MKKLLEKLLNDEGKLSLLLLEARQYAENANDEKLIAFINGELEGYTGENLPDYRKIKAVIIVTIKDAYGRITHQNVPFDFSKLSDSIDFDLSIVHMSDGIAFIEDTLVGFSGNLAERQIPVPVVEMLSKTFKFNNPHLNLSTAKHEINISAVRFILSKVRQDLISGLQKIYKPTEMILDVISKEIKPNEKNVFVTYAWESEDHNDKVISFVDFLLKKGYNASMDRKETQEETSINLNKMMIEGLQNSDKVIVILSPKYKEKADKFEGGVGTEFQIILEQIKSNTNKFIFVSFGNNTKNDIIPIGISGREILDLKKDQDQNEFNQLFAKLESKNIIQFSPVSEIKVEVKLKEIKPFKL